MKLLLLLALASATAGFGWNQRDDCAATSDCPLPICDVDCERTVVRIDDDLCRVDCTLPTGEECWALIECDPDGGCTVIETGGDECGDAEDCATACAAAVPCSPDSCDD